MKQTALTVLMAVALVSAGGAGDMSFAAPVHHNPAPVWQRLADLSEAERANAMIDLEREEPLARDIEHLWNTGHHGRALELFPELAPEEVGVSWREPIAAPESDWGMPVQVSARDSVVKVKLAADTVTGNSFCVLQFLGDGGVNHWSLNMSTDGGTSWAEAALWSASYVFPDIALTVVSGHAYVGYLRVNVNEAATRRYRVSDGTIESFPGGGLVFTLGSVALPDTLREIALTSNAAASNDRIYTFFNTRLRRARLYVHSTPGFADTVTLGGTLTDAARGVAADWNHGSSTHPLVFSYLDPNYYVRVYGLSLGGNVEPLFTGAMPSNGTYTALAAWKDTLTVVFDVRLTSTTQVRYLVRYGPGASWFPASLGDTLLGLSRSAAATGARGDGVAVTFWQAPQGGPGQCFRHRPYAGDWSPIVTIQQGIVSTSSERVPAIARVAPGVHGAVFYQGVANGIALFNRNDWTGIAEPTVELVRAERGPARMVRGALELRPTETGELFDASGRRLMTLAGGTNDLRHLAPGVYFLGIEEGGASYRQKLILAE
ncbi:MAG: T9SS type A sorting domain-containing protein [bacterium]